jgi:hypothetical protein
MIVNSHHRPNAANLGKQHADEAGIWTTTFSIAVSSERKSALAINRAANLVSVGAMGENAQ